MSTERGMNIQDAVDDMKRAEQLRKNEEFRNMKFHQQKKKKEADATAIATTSSDVNVKNTLNNYTKESEECQVTPLNKHTGDVFVGGIEMREHRQCKETQKGFNSTQTSEKQKSCESSTIKKRCDIGLLEGEVKTDVCKESDTPGDTPGREIRQQRRAELPVYLL